MPVDVAPGASDTFAPFGCPMGHGAPAADGTPTRPRRRGYFVPGLIALVAMLAGGAALNIGGLDHASPSRLAGSDVATFVAQGIQADRGLASPPAISCPSSEPDRAGFTFACVWHRGAQDVAIRVTETTRTGQFRFSVS